MTEVKKNGDHNKQIESIKRKLLERKSELEQQLADLYQKQEQPDTVQDPGDQAQSLSLETLKISLQDTELDEYNRIRQALKMIEQGTYGICIDCDQPISEKRLKLYPNATRCLVCQEILEERRHEVL
ncbi:MAG: TraR/DksA C4-type zinc finger protein [Candidatus Babeliales bacterium]